MLFYQVGGSLVGTAAAAKWQSPQASIAEESSTAAASYDKALAEVQGLQVQLKDLQARHKLPLQMLVCPAAVCPHEQSMLFSVQHLLPHWTSQGLPCQ